MIMGDEDPLNSLLRFHLRWAWAFVLQQMKNIIENKKWNVTTLIAIQTEHWTHVFIMYCLFARFVFDFGFYIGFYILYILYTQKDFN